jgi:hypothetical protein
MPNENLIVLDTDDLLKFNNIKRYVMEKIKELSKKPGSDDCYKYIAVYALLKKFGEEVSATDGQIFISDAWLKSSNMCLLIYIN